MSQADHFHSTIASEPPAASAGRQSAKPKRTRLSASKQRRLVETAIERLVALLDEIDPDPDLEDDASGEPSLGWPVPDEWFGHRIGFDTGDDREQQCEDEGAQCEDEGAEHDGAEPFGLTIPGGAGI
jgi:hypothetical protein